MRPRIPSPWNVIRHAALASAVMLGMVASGNLAAQEGGSPYHKLKPAKPLEAEAPIGSRIRRDPETMEAQARDRFFDAMARCIVKRAPAKADYFLRMSDDFGMADALGDITEFLPLPTCVGAVADPFATNTQARFTTILLRNWLSEETYLAAHPAFAALAPDAAPAPERTYYSRGGVMMGQAYGAFSDCIVRENAQAADALVRTQRYSPEERAAARALVPAMSACLTDGQSLALKESMIRGLAAQGLWQRYEAPKPIQYKAKR